jgi:arylsulfatase A-like enzyme/lysophospholipase L1-like esterase
MNAIMASHIIMKYLLALTALLLVPLHALQAKDETTSKPNVILIMTDDQGYGDLACHGNPDVKTPELDRLKNESVSLSNFHVDSYCTPTRSALMTGRYSHRVGGWGTVAGRNMLRDSEVTMAEVFRHNDYRTGLFGKWHLGTHYPYRPIDRGFEEWLGKGDGGTGCATDYWGNDRVNDVFIHNGDQVSLPGYETDVLFGAAKDFIKKNKQQPFFVYLAPYAVHSPESVPDLKWLEPYAGKVPPTIADFYAVINNIDKNIGALREMLRQEGLAKNTLLIFMTDNGSARNPFPAGMRGMKGSHYDGGHRVPCFVHWPAGGIGAPKTVDRLTAHLDLLPTFIDLCALKLPKPVRFDGTSLRPLLMDAQPVWADRTLMNGTVYNGVPLPRPKWERGAVMRENWRLIDGEELYNIATDPAQQVNVAAKHPKIVEELKASYETYWQDITADTQDWVRTLGRPIVGTAAQRELNLCSEDWVSDGCPWNQSAVAQGAKKFGAWRVRVQAAGVYRLEVRRWPREIDSQMAGVPPAKGTAPDAWLQGKPVTGLLYGAQPKALPVAQVSVKIGGQTLHRPVQPEDRAAVFEVTLTAGEQTIEARLLDASGADLAGAYFVYLRENKPPQAGKIRVACIGDSITAGARLTDPTKDSYPAQLQLLLGERYEVTNYGVGGCTLIRKGKPNVWPTLKRIQNENINPDVVVISLGTNDTCGGTRKCWEHKDDFPGDYRDLIDALRALPSKPRIWICAPSPMVLETPGLDPNRKTDLTERSPRLQELIAVIKQIAKDKQVGLIDLNTPLADKPELFTEKDGVHPNQAGYQAIAELVSKEMKQPNAIKPTN